ncbi:MAG: 5-dehydro-4-deoxy-D-glucuronate isomerase [Bacteroidetes bacterium]|nr:5-dehydro-4-deoxy-D-glucuronate isomerase [Bacteroidota bacterium]MDA1121946.1 5-dehydro-4-deoxy-D-glucuronate isomerase [Bacteroidota bacterium]
MTEVRFSCHPNDVKNYTTQELRDHFLIDGLMKPGGIKAVYSMYDRMMVIGIVPTTKAITLPSFEDVTKASYFLERRELGVINIGGVGKIIADKETFILRNKECVYIGKGYKKLSFESEDPTSPAQFYANSCPAHKELPAAHAKITDANQVDLGSKANCNERTIYQYIHEGCLPCCQLVMGFTELKKGSIWNTFPPHTHHRRMETYFYFDLNENEVVMHFMGTPDETRHVVVRNNQAIISPEWSIHAGAATSNYHFIWAMAGENKAFTDMDVVDLKGIL